MTITIIVIRITIAPAPGLSGRRCLCALTHVLDDFASGWGYQSAKYKERLADRPEGWPPGLMEPGAPRGSREKPWATVWWADITGCGFRVYAEFWPTKEAARAHKGVDPSAIVVNVTRKAKTETVDSVIRQTTIPPLEHPYPPEKPNYNPAQVGGTYDGFRNPSQYNGTARAAARPVGSTFHQ